MGFPVPFAAGLRGGWNGVARDVLLDSPRARSAASSIPPPSNALLDDHARRPRPTAATRIWSLLNLELWYRTFIDGEGVQTLPVPLVTRDAPDPALQGHRMKLSG